MLLQPSRAVAIRTRPRLSPVLVTAILAIVRVFHAEQLKIFLPIRPLFLQRRRAETGLDPMRGAVFRYTRVLQIVKVLVPRNRAFAERTVLYRVKKRVFASRLY